MKSTFYYISYRFLLGVCVTILLQKNDISFVNGYTLGGHTNTAVDGGEVPGAATKILSEDNNNPEPPTNTKEDVGSDLGVPQAIDMYRAEEIYAKITSARIYIDMVVNTKDVYEPIRDQCKNFHDNCAFWSLYGECDNNPVFMRTYCAPICHSCEKLLEVKDKEGEFEIASSITGFENYQIPSSTKSSEEMVRKLELFDISGSAFGEPQRMNEVHSKKVEETIRKAHRYMKEVVYSDDFYEPVRDLCKNNHTDCAFWASLGECENNPGYMTVQCAPVCQTCELISIETRCPLDKEAVDVLYPNDLNNLFERITTDPVYQKFEPKIHSRPSYVNGDTKETADYIIGPWLITLENVVSKEEADTLIRLGGVEGYKRSADVGDRLPDGTYGQNINEGRTSMNAWCMDACYNDTSAQNVIKRIENITGVPEINSEYLQLLRYEEGQFYQSHNDYIPHQTERQSGVRILTFYLYLNDVEEGGNTRFTNLDIEVEPKVGRAALWPSVLNDNPNKRDDRTDHQAMPVLKGVKYGANAWLHQRDFKSAHKVGCA